MKSLRKKPRCKQLAVEFRTNSQGDCSYLISASPSPKLYGSRNLPDRNASLDGLPVELKWAVLQEIPDLPTLQSLIRASPAYYYAYNGQLQPILSAVLASDMGQEGFIDACALLEACTIKEGPSWGHDMIQFMTGYQVDRALCLASDLGDVNRLVQIMQFHRMVHDMTKKFSQDALTVHPKFRRPSQVYEEELSSTEVHRFHRGFYRFQIICVLFGKRHDQVFYNVQGGRNRVSERTRFAFLDQFLSIFDPWEVEEINCIVLYIFRYYHEVLEKTDFNLDPEVLESVTRRRSWRLYRWEHTMEFLPQSSKRNWKRAGAERCTSLGLQFWNKFLTTESSAARANLLREKIATGSRLVTQILWQQPHITIPMSEENRKHAKAELNFISEEEGPNAAWVWSRGYTYYLCTRWPGKDWLLFWAYVMWDFERLERWEILTGEYQLLLNWYQQPECVYYPHLGETRPWIYELRPSLRPQVDTWLRSGDLAPTTNRWRPWLPRIRSDDEIRIVLWD